MAEEYNQRAHMEQVLREGGSVYHRGRIIAHAAHLPSHSDLARGDREQEAVVRQRLERQRAALDEEIASLAVTDNAEVGDEEPGEDELPADFPGHAALAEAGITTRSQLEGMSDEDLTAVKGIGQATSMKIREALSE